MRKYSLDNQSKAFLKQNLLKSPKKRSAVYDPHSPSSQVDLDNSRKITSGTTVRKERLQGKYAIIGYLKLMLFSFDYNIEDYLQDIDQVKYEQMKQILHIAPGYKPIRLIYGFYAHKYGILAGTLLALLYPLPYSLLFLYTPFDTHVPFWALFALAGLRSGAIGINIKYFLHWPTYKFQWIVLLFTAFISNIFQNNYIYVLLYVITVFLSLFLKDQLRNSEIPATNEDAADNRSSDHLYNQNVNFTQVDSYRPSVIQPNLPQTHPNLSLGLLVLIFLGLFVANKFVDDREIEIFFSLSPLSLLPYSKQMISFFPYLFKNAMEYSNITSATLIAASYLIPGPQIKVFMFLIYHNEPLNALIAYFCLYLPSILICNIFIGYYSMFCSMTYFNIRLTIQAVSNGLVFSLVILMLKEEQCFFNTVACASIVIFAVAKLYRARQVAAMVLGIFLVSIRSIILHVNKGIAFEEQACLVPSQ